MDAARNNRIMLAAGLLLIGAGLLFLILQTGEGAAMFFTRLWPVFLICAGAMRIVGFAIERKPRTAIDGMVFVAVGGLFLASRANPDLNAVQLYGRYWILLLALYASVELVRHYTHRAEYGRQPRIFTLRRVLFILLIISTGVAANRLSNNSSASHALRAPQSLSSENAAGDQASIDSYVVNIEEASTARQAFSASLVNE